MDNEVVTLADVAKRANVSAVTVSNALNGRKGVSEATRKRILKIAETMGYIPNLSARSLAGGRTNITGVIVPFLTQFANEIIRGIYETLHPAGLDLLVYTTSDDSQRVRQRVGMLAQGLADSLIVFAPLREDRDIIHKQTIPTVVIDEKTKTQEMGLRCPTIGSNNIDGSKQIIDHLIALGHTRIALITGSVKKFSSLERLRGYKHALTQAGLPVLDALIKHGDYNEESGYQTARELLQLPEPPTAICAPNDIAALGVYRAAADAGLSIPEDLSVVGYDDIFAAKDYTPPLTTVSQSPFVLGQGAARLLLGLMHNIEPVHQHVTLPVELIVRASTSTAKTTLTGAS